MLCQALGLFAAFRAITFFWKTIHIVATWAAHRFKEFPLITELFNVDQEETSEKDSDWQEHDRTDVGKSGKTARCTSHRKSDNPNAYSKHREEKE